MGFSTYELQQLTGLVAGGLVLLGIVVAAVRWSRAIDAIFPDAARVYRLTYARRTVGSFFTGRGEHLTLHGEIEGVPIDVLAHMERRGRYRITGTTITATVHFPVRISTLTVSWTRPLHPMHLVSTGDAWFDSLRHVTCDAPDTARVVLTPAVRAALLTCPQRDVRLTVGGDAVVLSWGTQPATALELRAPLDLMLALVALSRAVPALDSPGAPSAPTPHLHDDGAAVLSRAFGFSPEQLEANRRGRLHPEQRARLARQGGGEAFGWLFVGALFAALGVAGGTYNYYDRMEPTVATFAIPATLGLILAGACCLGFFWTRTQRRARRDVLATGAPEVLEGPIKPWEIRGHGVAPRYGFTVVGRTFDSTPTWNAMLTHGAYYRVYVAHDTVLSIEPTRALGSDSRVTSSPSTELVNRCANAGMLINGAGTLPMDATDFHVDELPTVGCNNLRCARCDVSVRNVAGRDHRHRTDLAPARLAELYAMDDLATAAAFKEVDPAHRLYLCRCTHWIETDDHACVEPDFNPYTDPDVPWACAGHPVMTLPHDLDGVVIADQGALFDVVMEGLCGVHPIRTRVADQARGDWVTRLPSRLGAADAAVVVRAARAVLIAPIPRARAGALRFFRARADAAAQETVLALIIARSTLLVGVPDEVTPYPQADPTLEDAAWRVIEPLVATLGPARTLARAEALAGRGRPAIFTALAAHDAAWLMSAIEDIARAAPALAPDLNASLGRLPPEHPRKAIRDRLAAAIADTGVADTGVADTGVADTVASSAPALPEAGSLTFVQAMAYAGAILAVRDHQSDDEVRMYAVGAAGAHHLATQQVPDDKREALYEALRERGIRIGGAWPWSGHVWVADDAGFAVWNRGAMMAEGSTAGLRLRDGNVLPNVVARVVSFIDGADQSHRGVRCELTSGGSRVVAEEFAPPSQAVFDELITFDDDVRWATWVGYELAMWLGVPHVRFDGSVGNGDTLAIASELRALAAEVETLPDAGAFEQITRAFVGPGETYDVSLRVAADDTVHGRFIEAKVWNAERTRWRARWVAQGSSAALAAWLRRAGTPDQLLRTLKDLARLLANDAA